MNAETCPSSVIVCFIVWTLQWGRVLMNAETKRHEVCERRVVRFNGAAFS